MPLCNEGAPHALPTGIRQATGNEEKNQKSGKDFEEDDEFCMSIAALAYVAPLNRGEEIALIRPLESALSAGDSESIKKIVSVPSFASILEKVLEKNGNTCVTKFIK